MTTNQNNQKTILIVEDDDSLLRVLVDKFELEKFKVLFASNGKHGLEMALKNEPDLILLDILMPYMDGMTMLGKMRERNVWGKLVPVILLTNVDPNSEIILQITKFTNVFYMMKSDVDIQKIVYKVKEVLS